MIERAPACLTDMPLPVLRATCGSCCCILLPAGVYVPTQQYDEECAERRQLAARVEEMEAEAEAVGAQHELAKAEWQGEMAAAAAKHAQQMGKVRGRGCAGEVVTI